MYLICCNKFKEICVFHMNSTDFKHSPIAARLNKLTEMLLDHLVPHIAKDSNGHQFKMFNLFIHSFIVRLKSCD